MESEPVHKIELPLQFFENHVYPFLSDTDKRSLEIFKDSIWDKEVLEEEYKTFTQYNPTSDKGNDFYGSLLLPFFMLVNFDDTSSFENLKENFIEKMKELADVLYRDAFFRNSYDTLDAWHSCARFKEYQTLFAGLNILPIGARERIAGMSQELDLLWSQPETEQLFANSMADEYVAAGSGEGSMLVKMTREGREIIPEREYAHYNNIRPDLFPEKYQDYLQQLEDTKHPYILKL